MYNLNINKSSVVPTNLIVGRVLDKPFDTFQFKIFDGLDPLDLTGATLEFRGVTPDNKKVISTTVKITDAKSGEIEFAIPSNFYSSSGQFRNAYFRINKSGLTESTNDLLINVLNAVDLNLDDSQIIIDQLDKIIEDAIAKLDKELANVKLQISQVDGNIKALKKDVEDYKATFKVQMDAMQKQLDDLAKAINQTNIQRPQITLPNGDQYSTLDDKNRSSAELLSSLPNGIQSVYLRTAIDLPDGQRVIGIKQSINTNNDGQLTGVAVGGGNTYSITYSSGVSRERWKRLDGQVHKLTRDDGGSYITLSNKSKTTHEMLNTVDTGYKFITIGEASDLPSSWIYGFISTDGTGGFKSFLGTSLKGTVYSYNTITKVWKTLDRLEYGIATQSQNGLLSSTDKKKLDGLNNYNNATQTTSGLMSSSDKVKLDGLKNYNNATQTTSGLMSSTDKKKLDNSDVKDLLNQEAYYGVDGFLLDTLTNYEFVDVTATIAGNSVTTRYKVSPNVNFEIPLTNVYNDTSSTGFEVWEIQGSINDTRITVSRSKGVKVSNTTTASNNTSDVKIVGVYGVNKIK